MKNSVTKNLLRKTTLYKEEIFSNSTNMPTLRFHGHGYWFSFNINAGAGETTKNINTRTKKPL